MRKLWLVFTEESVQLLLPVRESTALNPSQQPRTLPQPVHAEVLAAAAPRTATTIVSGSQLKRLLSGPCS